MVFYGEERREIFQNEALNAIFEFQKGRGLCGQHMVLQSAVFSLKIQRRFRIAQSDPKFGLTRALVTLVPGKQGSGTPFRVASEKELPEQCSDASCHKNPPAIT
jgi:hypothetical protein